MADLAVGRRASRFAVATVLFLAATATYFAFRVESARLDERRAGIATRAAKLVEVRLAQDAAILSGTAAFVAAENVSDDRLTAQEFRRFHRGSTPHPNLPGRAPSRPPSAPGRRI